MCLFTSDRLHTLIHDLIMQNFMSLFEELSIIYSELDDDEEMVSPLQAASLIADWTDPQKTL